MRVLRLECMQFRCFPSLDLALHPEFTLLVGENGAGKTAVIDALSVGLGGWLSEVSPYAGETLGPDDVRVADGEKVPRASTVVATTFESGERRSRHRAAFGPSVDPSMFESLSFGQEAHESLRDGEAIDLPLLFALGVKRGALADASLSAIRPQEPTHESGRQRAYYARSAGFEKWMLEREQERLQQIGDQLEADRPPSRPETPELDAVQAVIVDYFEGSRLRFNMKQQTVTLQTADGEIPLRTLSSGQRRILEMTAELAWRCVVLNPHLGRDAPRKTDGVVLIDEIDLHLHPRWQRSVIESLRRAFPRLQFIATTHSPQVVSSARGEWVRVLSNDGRVLLGDNTYGRDSNGILTEVFGVAERPEDVEKQVEALFSAIDAERYDEARAQLGAIEALLGGRDVDVVRARWLLDREDPRPPAAS